MVISQRLKRSPRPDASGYPKEISEYTNFLQSRLAGALRVENFDSCFVHYIFTPTTAGKLVDASSLHRKLTSAKCERGWHCSTEQFELTRLPRDEGWRITVEMRPRDSIRRGYLYFAAFLLVVLLGLTWLILVLAHLLLETVHEYPH